MEYPEFMSGVKALAGSGLLEYKENVSLSELSTFRIGGDCPLVIYPKNSYALRVTVRLALSNGVDFGVFGRCSDVLFSDKGWHGVLIVTTKMKSVARRGCSVIAECGVLLGDFAGFVQKSGLSGAEFMYGIPGSIGGSVYMNAGAFDSSVSDIITKCTCYSSADDSLVTLTRDEMEMGYRDSIFMRNAGQFVILEAEFGLQKGDPAEIHAKMEENMSKRRATQPVGYPSAGSVFKRPGEGIYAGRLIEDAGLKGKKYGGAMISPKHAGFIVNDGNAAADEVIYLIELARQEVLKRTGIRLESEIVFFGDREE